MKEGHSRASRTLGCCQAVVGQMEVQTAIFGHRGEGALENNERKQENVAICYQFSEGITE